MKRERERKTKIKKKELNESNQLHRKHRGIYGDKYKSIQAIKSHYVVQTALVIPICVLRMFRELRQIEQRAKSAEHSQQ